MGFLNQIATGVSSRITRIGSSRRTSIRLPLDLSDALVARYRDDVALPLRQAQIKLLQVVLMTDAFKTPATSAEDEPARVFQCVCGQELTVPGGSTQTLRCLHCGRVISPGMLEQSMASLEATVIGATTSDTDDMLLMSDERLDHYSLIDLLGAGGMGAVYRARDESLQRYVAIKVIRSRDGEGDRLRCERLIQEARAQARVNHPNVVHIYYVGTHESCPFFAMELVPGQSLAMLIHQHRLTFSEIIRIGLQAVDALRYSASLGIVHGDVKPENILLDEHGCVKLSDFGLASRAEKTDCVQSQNGPEGTLNYMAPEVAAGQPADVRSDMYSLGVMFYEMTFGELPLATSTDNLQESLRLRQQATVKFPATWPTDRPTAWKDVLSRLVHRDPSERFGSYEELTTELSRIRPVTLLRAGRISRFVAWILDMTVTGCLSGSGLALSLLIASLDPSQTTMQRILAPIFICFAVILFRICGRLQSTPGKKLLQLRIVDEFGLQPVPWKLRLSVVSTFLPYLGIVIDTLMQAMFSIADWPTEFKTTLPGRIIGIVSVFWILINAIFLVFSGRRQSLSDYLLGLFVVLDSGDGKER